jgi:hypothetical protein
MGNGMPFFIAGGGGGSKKSAAEKCRTVPVIIRVPVGDFNARIENS